MTSPLYSLQAWQSVMPELISKVYGLEGSGVFRRRGMKTILCKIYSPTNPQTSLQQANRSMHSYAIASWKLLTLEEKQSWNYYQDYRRRYPVMSGYNLYVKMFMLTKGNPQIPPK